MNSCAIGVAVQCRPRRHFLRSLSPATEHAKLVYLADRKHCAWAVQGVLCTAKKTFFWLYTTPLAVGRSPEGLTGGFFLSSGQDQVFFFFNLLTCCARPLSISL